jgi:hypothetical protein
MISWHLISFETWLLLVSMLINVTMAQDDGSQDIQAFGNLAMRIQTIDPSAAASSSSSNPVTSSGSSPSYISSSVSYNTVYQNYSCYSGTDIIETLSVTSYVTSTICPSCDITTFITISTPYSSSVSSAATSSSAGGTALPPPSGGDIPYASFSDFGPYLPCEPGSFLCTDANTFWTCDINPDASWSWQYPRQVAAGMACLPSLSPLPPGLGQQSGAPAGYYRSDQYRRARPNGGCSPDGNIGCLRGGAGWEMCDHGGWVDMGPVAAGTTCRNGRIVNAS